jgi:hypothetical protein
VNSAVTGMENLPEVRDAGAAKARIGPEDTSIFRNISIELTSRFASKTFA